MSAGENATPRLTAEVAAPAGALSETKPPVCGKRKRAVVSPSGVMGARDLRL